MFQQSPLWCFDFHRFSNIHSAPNNTDTMYVLWFLLLDLFSRFVCLRFSLARFQYKFIFNCMIYLLVIRWMRSKAPKASTYAPKCACSQSTILNCVFLSTALNLAFKRIIFVNLWKKYYFLTNETLTIWVKRMSCYLIVSIVHKHVKSAIFQRLLHTIIV